MPDEPTEQEKADVALADAIGDDPLARVGTPVDQPKTAPKEEKGKPKSGDPGTPKETAEEAEERVKKEAEAAASKGKPKDGEKPKDGDEPPEDDPLKGLELKDLLEHSVLGPIIQHWSDTTGNTRIKGALETERESLATSAKRTAEEEQSNAHFASLSQEQVIEEITGDEDAALRYAQYKARLKAGTDSGMSPEAIVRTSEIYSIGSQVRLNLQMLEGSELPQEVKDQLKPENYNKPEGEGLTAWGEAIFKALVTQEAEKVAQGLLESKWEAYQQEHLAETDGERPAATGGRKTPNLPDLITTPTDQLWDGAFEGRKPDKEGAK